MEWPKTYAVRHKSEDVRSASRSGGIFTALSDYILDDLGVVYGCVLTDAFQAVHVRAENKMMRDRMRGSKYIQSRMGDTYKNVEADLNAERKVLFSGSSCQIAGLKCYLKKDYDNLVCVDIVCHGVPSPKVWIKYLEEQRKRNGGDVASVDFRNKNRFGWRSHVESITFDTGYTVDSEIFKRLFYGHNVLRPSCYECPYKSIHHPGDITIADYWGIEKAAPEFDDNMGVSLVLVNTMVGWEAFESVKEKVLWKPTRIEDSLQPPLVAPFPRPKERDQFWRDFPSKDFEYLAKKYGVQNKEHEVIRIIRKIKRKLVR